MKSRNTDSNDFYGLPPFLGALARHMGSAAGARRLAEVFGGQRKSIPRVARRECIIAKACGMDVMCALVELRGGETIYVPFGGQRVKKNLIAVEIEKDLISGKNLNSNKIAKRIGCSERYVRAVKKNLNGRAARGAR